MENITDSTLFHQVLMLLFLIVAQVGADNRKEMFLHLLMVACTGLCYDSS